MRLHLYILYQLVNEDNHEGINSIMKDKNLRNYVPRRRDVDDGEIL